MINHYIQHLFYRRDNMVINFKNIKDLSLDEILKMHQNYINSEIDRIKQFVEWDYKDWPYIKKEYEDLTQKEKLEIYRKKIERYREEIEASLDLYVTIEEKKQAKDEIKKLKKLAYEGKFTEEEIKKVYFEKKSDYMRDIDSFNNEAEKILNQKILIGIEKEFISEENFAILKSVVETFLSKQIPIQIFFTYIDAYETEIAYVYSKDEINQIIELNNYLIDKGMKEQIVFNECCHGLYFDWGNNYSIEGWGLNDVIKANREIDRVVSYIKEKNYSPYEAMVYIHIYITSNFQYNNSSDGERRSSILKIPSILNMERSRSIIGAYNGDIVCAGYATLVKAIVDRLNNPNLKCDIIGCTFYKQKSSLKKSYEHVGAHSHNLIHITDEEYGIIGHYMEDACWDSKTPEMPKGKGFARFMYPVSDLEKFNNFKYVQFYSSNMRDDILFKKFTIKERLKVLFNAKPDVVKKYGGQSEVITLEKFDKALHRVLASNINVGSVDNYYEDMLKKSAQTAQESFNKTATSCFMSIPVKNVDNNRLAESVERNK